MFFHPIIGGFFRRTGLPMSDVKVVEVPVSAETDAFFAGLAQRRATPKAAIMSLVLECVVEIPELRAGVEEMMLRVQMHCPWRREGK